MAGGRHGPARFSHYLRAHHGDLAGLIRDGFVEPGQTLEFEPVPGGFIAEGEIHCTGGIVAHVRKLAEVVGEEGSPPEPVVRTGWYSYNIAVQGLGVLRPPRGAQGSGDRGVGVEAEAGPEQ